MAAVVASVFNLESVCVSSAGNLLLPGFMQEEEEEEQGEDLAEEE